jgi:hypothetical protein
MNGNNMLPELPKKRKNEEAVFGEQIVDYVNKLRKPFFEFTVWQELKVSDEKGYFRFEQVEPHQVVRCQQIKTTGMYVRIVDARVGKKVGIPDYVWIYKQPAYIVIRYPKSWCFIDIDTFVLEKERSKKKSMTEERARKISIKVILKK